MPETLWIPASVAFLLSTLQEAGFECYVVGGAVRDLLLHSQTAEGTAQPPQKTFDFDLTTNATPEQIQTLFPESFYENEFGTVGVALENITPILGFEPPTAQPVAKNRIIDLARATKVHDSLVGDEGGAADEAPSQPVLEITTYRSKELYETGHRRPSTLTWGSSIQEDLTRRDFTCNALAFTISPQLCQKILKQKTWWTSISWGDITFIDEFNGLADLSNSLLKTVGSPTERFTEDALRLLRAVRFSVQLNFEIQHETYQALCAQSGLITHISWERIRDELFKILASRYPAEGIEILDDTGLLQHILPELLEGKGVKQGGHHTTDVWTHSIDALRYCPATDPLVRLATLLHDVAKPRTMAKSGDSVTFYNHELIGARVAKEIGKRLKLSKDQNDRLFTLVRQHMFYYQPHNTDASIRRFMRKVGLNNIDDILDLREGDRLGSGARKTSWRLEEMKQRMIDQLHQPMDARDLALNGHDLMTELQLKPGPILGEIITFLLECVLENPELNTKEELLKLAQRYLSEGRSSLLPSS